MWVGEGRKGRAILSSIIIRRNAQTYWGGGGGEKPKDKTKA